MFQLVDFVHTFQLIVSEYFCLFNIIVPGLLKFEYSFNEGRMSIVIEQK